MKPLFLLVVGIASALLIVSSAPAQEALRYETADWIFTAPASLGTQADLELTGRQVQLCHDEIELLTGYRPPRPEKFTVEWVISDTTWYSGARPTGWVNSVPPSYRLVSDTVRAVREDIVRRGACFGPHEVTHVLTFSSPMPGWAFEGLATFTDFVYQSASWGCCSRPPKLLLSCDETGYTDGLERHAYSDLSPYTLDYDSYRTAACFWLEIHRLGGFPAIRGILAGLRHRRALTTGELVVHHAGRVLNRDLRPIAARYGFDQADLAAGPLSAIPGCTLIGTAAGEAIVGTAGPDTICGLGGNDRLTGGAGVDVLSGGIGNDVLNARDRRRDVVRGGPGRDSARIDRHLDRVKGVERILR